MLFIKSLLVLCSAAVVFARNSGEAVASRAIFFGEDTSDSSANPYDIYANPKNHASAVSSVLVFAANEVDFRPSEQQPKELGSNYEQFFKEVSAFPGFRLERDEQVLIPLDGTRIQFENAVFDTNPYYLHQSQVARNLRSLIPQRAGDNGGYWLLSLIAIDKPEDADAVKIALVSVIVYIETDRTGKVTIPVQEAIVRTSFFQARSRVLVGNADQFSEAIPIVHVPEAEKFFDSEKEDEDMIPCHQKPAAFVNQAQRALENWYSGNY
ncbi:hypothetical protein EMPS_04403 [Entomortierella parvispora]|uniref:Uncharacterized protein n=1 Tax=Entomortierella parvispora TaxID=205924 RepID=A0A9P3H8K8_9FUNG|nr:hypothetical protein EMPS_04403 [Entomortierella parvispora]